MTDTQPVPTGTGPFDGGARAYIDVPPVAAATGGVLSVANVIDVSGHELMGAQYLTDACVPGYVWDEFCTQASTICPAFTASPTGQKVFDAGPDVVAGDPFAIYAGVECDLMQMAEAKERAVRRLAYSERRLVDARMLAFLESVATTPAGTTDYVIPYAVGLLEEHAAEVYGGVPTILMPIDWVTQACARQVVFGIPGGQLMTAQGALVAGLATGAPPGAKFKVYATGRITLLRGPVQSYAVPFMPGCDRDFPPRALAERVYVPLVECFVASADICEDVCPSVGPA